MIDCYNTENLRLASISTSRTGISAAAVDNNKNQPPIGRQNSRRSISCCLSFPMPALAYQPEIIKFTSPLPVVSQSIALLYF
ncbi:hypothetical protein [Ferruginibacter sp.]|uniref:hypothetical protein n=1 Tax=Ferruginibacter sp. TaxID=1940288 RepID=UPI00374DFB63